MLNPFKDVNWNPGIADRRKFAKSLMIGFPIIAIVFALISFAKTHAVKPFCYWLGGVGFAVGFVLWLVPQIAKPFYLIWYFIGCSIGIVVSNVIMGVFYYGIMTPTGAVLRTLRKLSLRKTLDRGAATYWQDVEKPVDLKRYYRQF
jgi:hypothetical protein